MLREVLAKTALRHIRLRDTRMVVLGGLVLGVMLAYEYSVAVVDADERSVVALATAVVMGIPLAAALLVMQTDHDGPTLAGAIRAATLVGVFVVVLGTNEWTVGGVVEHAALIVAVTLVSLRMYGGRRRAAFEEAPSPR